MAYFQSKPAAGRHFLQIPGPTNVPDRVLRAIDNPTMDHRGPDFGKLGLELLAKLRPIFKTAGPVVIYPASGTGAWEAALVNTLSPGDRVLMCETGWFAHLWREMAERLSLRPEFITTDWRRGADAPGIEARLRADKAHEIKAVAVVHNETSTGCTSRIEEVRRAIDAAGHPALLLVDTISSLGSIDYRHDEWGVDVTVAGSQKGLMLPPGLSFNAISEKALRAAEGAKLPRSFWDWRPMLAANATGYFPYTPATNLLYGLDAAADMLLEEGLDNVFARHDRHAEATRRAVRAWGLEVQCADPRHYSSSLTAVRLPEGHSANALRQVILERHNMSLGNGLGQLNDRVFRIGHLGDFGDLQLVGTLGGVEMGLRAAGVPHQAGGCAGGDGVFGGGMGEGGYSLPSLNSMQPCLPPRGCSD
ncbi:alanine--glyoxylate aminotransferase family protein [Siccirubricoccus sp. G192]|uniref:pyridoxal-phosphate-dependent aminotransferase family protein n=1 Tax=Siccirubricoccus sp. G192 TaxID=2849651 RepID=UPI001C2C1734|nr:aminotransferase class V-fold PLP-dependent enzyme [Siccirubricoccus sp. G192]MBV1798185.1 aminotransferase class V-fold PLP-dependent enzyme [Siccirubricoccus sp. G192]